MDIIDDFAETQQKLVCPAQMKDNVSFADGGLTTALLLRRERRRSRC